MSISMLFIAVALALFGIATFGVSAGRFNLLAAGLFFFVLSQLMGHVNV